MVNQIEFHPGCQQRGDPGLLPGPRHPGGGLSPWAGGRVLDHPTLTAIAQNHGKTPTKSACGGAWNRGPPPAQVGDPARMAENGDLFTFALTPEDMAQIAALPPFGGSGHDPDQLDF